MFLFLSKILPLPFYPLTLVLLLGSLAIVTLIIKKNRLAVISGAAGLGLLWISTMPLTSHLLVRSLECRYEQQYTYPLSSAIVVLGGGTMGPIPPRKYVEVADAGDRILYGSRLIKQGFAPWIIVTGGKIDFVSKSAGSEAQNYYEMLRDICCVDTAKIILEEQARTTAEHIPYVKQILAQRGLPNTILVVTSAMHMYRSVMLFEKGGFTVHPAPTDYHVGSQFTLNLSSIVPNPYSLIDIHNALHEYYGIIAYRLFKKL